MLMVDGAWSKDRVAAKIVCVTGYVTNGTARTDETFVSEVKLGVVDVIDGTVRAACALGLHWSGSRKSCLS